MQLAGVQAEHRPAGGSQRPCQPVHLGAIGRGLVRDDDGRHRLRRTCRGGDGRVHVVHQAARAADQIEAQLGVALADLRGETHAPGDRVQLDQAEAFACEHQVGPHHQGEMGAEAVHPAQLDDLRRLALVQVAVDPRRRQAPHALLVQEVGGPVEAVDRRTESVQESSLSRRQAEWLRRDAPGQIAVGVHARPIALEQAAARRTFVDLQAGSTRIGCRQAAWHGSIPASEPVPTRPHDNRRPSRTRASERAIRPRSGRSGAR